MLLLSLVLSSFGPIVETDIDLFATITATTTAEISDSGEVVVYAMHNPIESGELHQLETGQFKYIAGGGKWVNFDKTHMLAGAK